MYGVASLGIVCIYPRMALTVSVHQVEKRGKNENSRVALTKDTQISLRAV